jgi:hypothetical protein
MTTYAHPLLLTTVVTPSPDSDFSDSDQEDPFSGVGKGMGGRGGRTIIHNEIIKKSNCLSVCEIQL